MNVRRGKLLGYVKGRVMAASLTTWILLVFAEHAMATWTFSPSCYRVQDVEADWVTSWLKCQELGAHLAIESDTGEHTAISQYLQTLGRTDDYWIGGRKTLDTAPLIHSSFQWVTEFRGTQNKCPPQSSSDRVNCTEMGVGLTCQVLGCCWDNTTTTPGVPACYFPTTRGALDSGNWLAGEPNNTPSPEMCVEEKYSAGGHSWNDKNCLLQTRSLCETFLTCVHPLTDQRVPCGYTITRTCPPGTATTSPTLVCESSATSGSFAQTMGWNGTYDPCTDIDECLEGSHNCHPNASCSNSPFPFSCACKQGFIGDGWTCAPYATQPNPGSSVPGVSPNPGSLVPGVSQNSGSLVPGVSPNPGSLVPGVSPNPGSLVPGVSPNPGSSGPGVSPNPGSLVPDVSQNPGSGGSQNPGSPGGVSASSHPGISSGGGSQHPSSAGAGVSPQPGPGSGPSQGPGSAVSQADSSTGSNDATAAKPGTGNCGPCDWAGGRLSGAMVVVMNNIGGTSDNLAVVAITLVVCLLLFLLGCLLAYLIRKRRNMKSVELAPPEYHNVRQTKAEVPTETGSFTTETTIGEKRSVTPAWSPISMYRGKSSRVW
ncbi:PREDICTED: uncharacterized protein LOC109485221 [Branchiostoma belcheri]|uniref:Uncharacterized protein LOC109485221 n=1 Tax=Branchiostoma belcheri TaxID=7741 RepID=A0A6P5AQD7_BRABE|nr:PREDICTED: uncharacterized protein LOC109485221 [Branchiostoma belcheri]